MRTISMRTALLLLALVPLAACSDDDDGTDSSAAAADPAAEAEDEETSNGHEVFFGWLLGSDEVAAVALDFSIDEESGEPKVAAYVCDGQGPPEGMAVWFSSPFDEASISNESPLTAESVAGGESLAITSASTDVVLGSFTDAEGDSHPFAATPATAGAGIYQVTVDEDLAISGTSSDGSTLEGTADEDGATEATITTADGQAIEFTVHNLSLASPVELAAHGLPDEYSDYAETNQVPGEYTALIAPGGSHWLGRAGAVRLGDLRAEIIGLDKKEISRTSLTAIFP